MPCSPKTMLKIAVVIAVPLILGFIFVPQLRAAIISLAPLALFAVCPISMIFCMKGMMSGEKKGETCQNCAHDNKQSTIKKHEHVSTVS